MSVKKRIKPGRLEPSADGQSIVVHFTNEITHLDEDGKAMGTDKVQDKREVSVAKQLRGLREQDIPALAQEIVEKCRYIPASKTRQVEQVLSKLLSAIPPDPWAGGHFAREPSAGSRGNPGISRGSFAGSFFAADDMRATRMASPIEDVLQLSDVLPEAHISHVDDYADELYEEEMEAKTLGAQRLLRICTETQQLEEISGHSTLLGVLSRELRENSKRSHELTVAITGIFLCLGHFSKFHPVLVRHECNDMTMRVLEYESKRRTVLTKEIDLKRGRLVALGSQATHDNALSLRREEDRYNGVLDRQDRLLQLCLLVLRILAEDVTVERMLVRRHICKFLTKLLDRDSEDLLLVTLGFLHKLVAFEENKDQLVQQPEILSRLFELTTHPCTSVVDLAMRVCYNLSFDCRARHAFASQTKVLGTLVATVKQKSQKILRKTALRLLYQLTMDNAARTAISEKCPECIALALQLVVNSPESRVDKIAVAICVNFAAHRGCAEVIVEQEMFAKVAVRAVQFGDATLLKVLRHMTSMDSVRPRLLEVLAADNYGGSTWLHELVVLSSSPSTGPDLLVECMGIFANLQCQTPEVQWPDLIEAGLLELLQRLFTSHSPSDDDVLLECIMLTSVLALDPASAPLLAASKVPSALPRFLTDKHEDAEILVQLLFTLRCLLLQEDNCEVLLRTSDVPDRILDLFREVGDQDRDTPCWQVIRASAEEILELIIAADSQDGHESHWAERIKAFRFRIYNEEWYQREFQSERPLDMKSGTACITADTKWSGMRWTDTDGLADRNWGNMPGFDSGCLT
jgi:hypothetical protein